MTTVLLVRHGETAWNRERRLQGWAPVGLNDRGERQAAAVADHLAGVHDPDGLHASDLRRTRETAVAIADAAGGLEPVHDRAWRERGVGVLQGLPYERLFDHPELSVRHAGDDAVERAPEDGETLLAMRDRVLDGWERLLDGAGDGGTHVVVTHGGPIALLLGHLKDMSVAESVSSHSIHNCAITELRADGDGEVTVARENHTGWQG